MIMEEVSLWITHWILRHNSIRKLRLTFEISPITNNTEYASSKFAFISQTRDNAFFAKDSKTAFLHTVQVHKSHPEHVLGKYGERTRFKIETATQNSSRVLGAASLYLNGTCKMIIINGVDCQRSVPEWFLKS